VALGSALRPQSAIRIHRDVPRIADIEIRLAMRRLVQFEVERRRYIGQPVGAKKTNADGQEGGGQQQRRSNERAVEQTHRADRRSPLDVAVVASGLQSYRRRHSVRYYLLGYSRIDSVQNGPRARDRMPHFHAAQTQCSDGRLVCRSLFGLSRFVRPTAARCLRGGVY
jgi:hypothetical protein